MSEAKKPAKKAEEGEASPMWGTVAKWGGILLLLGFGAWLVSTNVAATSSLLLLCIGIGGALSILLFLWGFGIYITRFGNDNRMEGIERMTWGVTVLFVVILLGGVLRFIEAYLA